jgi:transposase
VRCDRPVAGPGQAGDRVKTDRHDAKKLAALFRGDLLRFVQPPTPQTEGLRDLLRCRADIRCARTAARHRVAKQLLRHGRIFREGKKAWTVQHRAWVLRQQPEDPLAHEALSQMLTHLDSLDRQLATLDAQLEHVARHDRWGARSPSSARSGGSGR